MGNKTRIILLHIKRNISTRNEYDKYMHCPLEIVPNVAEKIF